MNKTLKDSYLLLHDIPGAKKIYQTPHIKTLALDCGEEVCGVETSLGSGSIDIPGDGNLSKDNNSEPTGHNNIWGD